MSDSFARLKTALADRYAIERELGAGGMAVVYLAQVYEARGNVDGAIDYYGRFADLWADADPELQPLVTEARESIQRLTQERR